MFFSNCYIGKVNNDNFDIEGLKQAVKNLNQIPGNFKELVESGKSIRNLQDLNKFSKNPALNNIKNNMFDPFDYVNIIKFPVHPAEFNVSGGDIELNESKGEYNTISYTEGITPIEVSFSSFFPIHSDTYSDLIVLPVFEYIKIINRFRISREPVKLVLTNKNNVNINMTMWIKSFSYSKKANGNIDFDISFREAQEPNTVTSFSTGNNLFYKPGV